MTATDIVIFFLLMVILLPILIGLLIMIVSKVTQFSNELSYYNREIARTEGRERLHWKRRRRRLWRSIFPFLRR